MTGSVLPEDGEHLSTGWESDVPAGDTLVRRAALAHASWPVAVASARSRPARRTERWAGAFLADTGELSNPVVLVQPVPASDAAAVVEEIAELVPPTSPYFLLSPWLSPDFSPHGLALVGHPPLMVRLPGPRAGRDPEGVRVIEALDEELLAVAERVLVEGYPMPGSAPGSVLGPRLLDSAVRVWVGFVEDRPVSVAAAHHADGVTLVEYVAALPAARGRGAGAAVTWAATLADPQAPAVLVASDDGRPTYERMGYVAVERWTAWLRPASPR